MSLSEQSTCTVCLESINPKYPLEIISCALCNQIYHHLCYGFIYTVQAKYPSQGQKNIKNTHPQEGSDHVSDNSHQATCNNKIRICQVCFFLHSYQPSPRTPECILCPHSIEYPMKRTTSGTWVHLTCAFWIPETFFIYGPACEPIDCLQVPKKRFNKTCMFCKLDTGACLDCSEYGCGKKFHVICAIKEYCLFEYQTNKNGKDIVVTFCPKHTDEQPDESID